MFLLMEAGSGGGGVKMLEHRLLNKRMDANTKSGKSPRRGFSCEQSCCPDKFSPHCKLGYRFQTTEAEFFDEI
jgi:hypothetical protein